MFNGYMYMGLQAAGELLLAIDNPEGRRIVAEAALYKQDILATLDKAGFNAWIITPNVGYTILQNDKQKMDLYAGARYFRIEFDATIDIDPITPGQPSSSRKLSPTVSNWDGIVGARGLYYLPGKWFIPYSVNVGTGDSDFTWGANAGFGYKFSDLSAIFGWRYLTYDVGSDTIIKELTLNGPFAGVVFNW